MRFIIFFMIVSCFSLSLVFGADETGFDTFIKSREVIATLYFQANSEDLAMGERDRILATISQLRKLQDEGRLIRVEGFSSPEGDKEVNFRLSFFRARSVVEIIEAEGLPAEVTLTGYGDLRAKSDDLNKERRVEIASYVKPVGMRKVKVVEGENSEQSALPGVTNTSPLEAHEIDSFTVDRAIRQKIADKQQKLADGLRKLDPASSPDLSQVSPPAEPIIDALTIEQAIMEKIGEEPTQSSDAVSQVSAGY